MQFYLFHENNKYEMTVPYSIISVLKNIKQSKLKIIFQFTFNAFQVFSSENYFRYSDQFSNYHFHYLTTEQDMISTANPQNIIKYYMTE